MKYNQNPPNELKSAVMGRQNTSKKKGKTMSKQIELLKRTLPHLDKMQEAINEGKYDPKGAIGHGQCGMNRHDQSIFIAELIRDIRLAIKKGGDQ